MAVSFKEDLVLVTGASGKQCGHLLPHLVAKFKRLRLVVQSEKSKDRLVKQYPDAEVLQMDMADQRHTARILKGVTSLYHVGPTFHFQELEIGYNMINAALEEASDGTFKHFVLASVINTQIRKLMNHDVKRYIEERLIESGLNFTIMQPCIFMDAFPIPLLMSQDKPVYKANWNVNLPFSFTALKDLGEAGALILEQREKHYLAQYQLVSSKPLTYKQAVGIVSSAIGKEVTIVERSFEEALAFYLDTFFGPGPHDPITRDTTERLLLYCRLPTLPIANCNHSSNSALKM